MARISEKERQRILRSWTEKLDSDSMGRAGSIYYCLKDSKREIRESLGKEKYKELVKMAEYVSDRCPWEMDDDEFSDLREKLEYIADVGRETMFGFSGKEGIEYAKELIDMADTASGGCSRCIDKIRRMRGKTKNIDRIMRDDFEIR